MWGLCIPLATKGLVDGAVGADLSKLKRYAVILVVLTLFQYVLDILEATLRIRTSARLQKNLQSIPQKRLEKAIPARGRTCRKELQMIRT